MQAFADKTWPTLGLTARVAGWAFIAVFVAGLCGCGEPGPGPLGNVSGKVTLGGEALAGEHVVFVGSDGGPAGSAKLSATGEFRLDQPIPVGEYRIAIEPPDEEVPAGAEPAEAAEPAEPAIEIPEKYRDYTTSGLTATVKEGSNDPFTFEME